MGLPGNRKEGLFVRVLLDQAQYEMKRKMHMRLGATDSGSVVWGLAQGDFVKGPNTLLYCTPGHFVSIILLCQGISHSGRPDS